MPSCEVRELPLQSRGSLGQADEDALHGPSLPELRDAASARGASV